MTSVVLAAARARVAPAWLVPALAAAVVCALALWAGGPYAVGVYHDDGVYALLARALASGDGFTHTHLPGAPAAVHYPPLYPLLLAAVWRMAPTFPDNLGALLSLNALLVGVSAWGMQRWLCERFAMPATWAALVAVAAHGGTPVLALATSLLSEPLFLALLWPALSAVERLTEPSDGSRLHPMRTAAAAGVLTGILMLARTHGIALLAAAVLVLAAQRRWRHAALVLTACALVVAPWQLFTAFAAPRAAAPLAGAYGSYLGWFVEGVREGGPAFVVATVRANVVECWLLLGDRLAAPGRFGALAVAVLAVGAALASGVAAAGRARTALLFVLAYYAIVLVWPYAPWRFAWGGWPVLLALGAGGCAVALRRLGGGARVGFAAALGVVAAAMLGAEWRAYRTRAWREPATRATAQIAPLVEWVRAATAPTDVVLAEGEPMVTLFTGRVAAPPTTFTTREYLAAPTVAESGERLRAMLGAVPARWLVVMNPSLRAAADAQRGSPALRRVPAPAGVGAYEVVR